MEGTAAEARGVESDASFDVRTILAAHRVTLRDGLLGKQMRERLTRRMFSFQDLVRIPKFWSGSAMKWANWWLSK